MKAVVIAAGEGKRLKPLTHTRPKCMITLAGKPIIHHVLDSLREAGFREVVVVVNYMKEKITGYLGDGRKFGVKIDYVEQKETNGTAGAFLAAEEYINDDFFGIAADIITESAAIKRIAAEHEGKITVGLKEVEDPEGYGVAILEGRKLVDFEEKPKKPRSNLVNCSMYMLHAGIFKELKEIQKSERGEYELTDLIKKSAARGDVLGVKLGEFWQDIGLPWQLFDANQFILSKMPARNDGTVEDSKTVGKVIIDKGAHIFNSFLEGPLYIGKNSTVGPFSYIRNNTSIGADCSIGDSTTVKNSILMDGVNAKHLTYIGDSVVGERCNFGAATQIANLRFDYGKIEMEIMDKKVLTNRNKLGVIIGDDTKTGVLACIMPGKTIGDNCWIGASVMVTQNIPRGAKVYVKQKLEIHK